MKSNSVQKAIQISGSSDAPKMSAGAETAPAPPTSSGSGSSSNSRGTRPAEYISLGAGPPQEIDGEVVEEALAWISVNGQDLATQAFMSAVRRLSKPCSWASLITQ